MTESQRRKARESYRAWMERNPDRAKELHAKWRAKNKDRIKQYGAQWRAKHHEAKLEGYRRWKRENPEKSRALSRISCSKRRARLAMPSWANQFFINEIYRLAQLRTKLTGHLWVVDHIIPLRGDVVCGLHVENNLRVILDHENRKKANRHDA